MLLRKWHIRNFKSFGHVPPSNFGESTFWLVPIAVAKAALFEARLLKQTLQYGSDDRPLTLNGPLLRLGEFADVLNHEALNERLSLGFEFEFADDDWDEDDPAPGFVPSHN